MDHNDHVDLLCEGVTATDATWADFGAGSGAFTLALAELLGPGAEIHAVDRDDRALREGARRMARHFPGTNLTCHHADISSQLTLPPLDGIVMANVLHFQPDQNATVSSLRRYLRPGGRIVIVEYNIKRPNRAVPHPVPAARWTELAARAGFEHTKLLKTRPSRTFGEIYSAASW